MLFALTALVMACEPVLMFISPTLTQNETKYQRYVQFELLGYGAYRKGIKFTVVTCRILNPENNSTA